MMTLFVKASVIYDNKFSDFIAEIKLRFSYQIKHIKKSRRKIH